MSLINCKECGKEISDKADKCPNCGCPIQSNIKKISDKAKMRRNLGIADFSIGIIFLIMIFMSNGGIEGNNHILISSWFFIITSFFAWYGCKKKGLTIVAIVFYSLGAFANLALSTEHSGNIIFSIVMIVFLVLTSISLARNEDFN